MNCLKSEFTFLLLSCSVVCLLASKLNSVEVVFVGLTFLCSFGM